jgi:ABC-type uncharacterized transport system permease subunit
MKINRQARHYKRYDYWLHNSDSLRALRLLDGIGQLTLCNYFWIVTLRSPGLWLWKHPWLGWPVTIAVGHVPIILLGVATNDLFGTLIGAYAGVVLIGLFFAFVYGSVVFSENAKAEVLREYIKAKKHKVCPFIEFEG